MRFCALCGDPATVLMWDMDVCGQCESGQASALRPKWLDGFNGGFPNGSPYSVPLAPEDLSDPIQTTTGGKES